MSTSAAASCSQHSISAPFSFVGGLITLDPINILALPLYFLPQLRQLPRGAPLHSVGLASIEVRLRVLSGSGSGGGVVGGSNGVQGVL